MVRKALATVVAFVTVAACADSPTQPATDVELVTGVASGVEKVEVCHYSVDEDIYFLITVADPALDKHLAHGDAQVGDQYPGETLYVFGSDCSPLLAPGAASGDVTLDFPGNNGDDGESDETTVEFSIAPDGTGTFTYTAYNGPLSQADVRRTISGDVSGVEVSGDDICFLVSNISDSFGNITTMNIKAVDGGTPGTAGDGVYWTNNQNASGCLGTYDFGSDQFPIIDGDIQLGSS